MHRLRPMRSKVVHITFKVVHAMHRLGPEVVHTTHLRWCTPCTLVVQLIDQKKKTVQRGQRRVGTGLKDPFPRLAQSDGKRSQFGGLRQPKNFRLIRKPCCGSSARQHNKKGV